MKTGIARQKTTKQTYLSFFFAWFNREKSEENQRHGIGRPLACHNQPSVCILSVNFIWTDIINADTHIHTHTSIHNHFTFTDHVITWCVYRLKWVKISNIFFQFQFNGETLYSCKTYHKCTSINCAAIAIGLANRIDGIPFHVLIGCHTCICNISGHTVGDAVLTQTNRIQQSIWQLCNSWPKMHLTQFNTMHAYKQKKKKQEIKRGSKTSRT